MLKKLLLSAVSIFLGYQSFKIWSTIAPLFREFDRLGIQVLGVLFLSATVTGTFAFMGFAWPTHKLLPKAYYETYSPSVLKKIYSFLNVELFRKALMLGYWGKKQNRAFYFDGTIGGLENLSYQSKQSEFGHLGPFLILNYMCMWLFFAGYATAALVLMLVNVVGNFYPIVLQRMHRSRIAALMRRYGQ